MPRLNVAPAPERKGGRWALDENSFAAKPIGMKDLDFMVTALTVSAVLIALWQTTLSPEEKFDPDWERYGSAAGLVLFVLVAAAVKYFH